MDFELMISSLPKLLNASLITLKLLSASLIFGLFIGLFFAILRVNKNLIINKFAYGYSYIFRGTTIGSNIHYLFWLRSDRIFKINCIMGYFKRTLLVCNNCFFIEYWSLHI